MLTALTSGRYTKHSYLFGNLDSHINLRFGS